MASAGARRKSPGSTRAPGLGTPEPQRFCDLAMKDLERSSTRSFHGLPRSRRVFLADLGMGFTGLALGAMLHRESQAGEWALPKGLPHFPPKAKSVIWLFMNG